MHNDSDRALLYRQPCPDVRLPRVGGPALIGGRLDWPTAPDGTALVLVASLPAAFLNAHAGFALPPGRIVSVFTYYCPDDYFLDMVTYHGSVEELAWLRQGYTRVILHAPGEAVHGAWTVPPLALEVADPDSVADAGQDVQACFDSGGHIGGAPGLLQQESLDLGNARFALQLYGGSFPRPWNGLFGLSDAIGYLYLDPAHAGAADAAPAEIGCFFVQVT